MAKQVKTGLRKRNTGVALVTVLVIVAIVSAIAVDIAMSQQLWLSQEQNLEDRTQADWVDRGARQYAAMVLDRDKRADKIDDLNEAWARPLPPFNAVGGKVAVSIEDLQGRFNLNSLYQKGKYNADAGAVFRRLLANAGVDANVQDAVLDWMDSDSRSRAAGAEDDYYQNRVPGYRAANQPMLSTRELLLIKGFNFGTVEKLEGVITALPQATAININTAPAKVLAALFNGMTVEDAKRIVVYRKQHPFRKISELKKAIPDSYKLPKESLLTTSSEFFLVRSVVQFGDYYRHSLAYLRRPGDAGASYYYLRDRPLIKIEEEKSDG